MAPTKTAQIIRQLKGIKEARNLSYQAILDMVEKSGGLVSLSTIRRVFAEGSEEQNFRYDDSIRPIVVALVGRDVIEPAAGDIMTPAEQDANALRSVNALKDDMITELQKETERLREENERIRADYEHRLKWVAGETGKTHEHIEAIINTSEINMQLLRSKDRIIFALASGLIGLLFLNCMVLVIDVLRADIGFVRGIVGRPLAIFGIFVVLLLIAAVCVIYCRIRSKGREDQRHGV